MAGLFGPKVGTQVNNLNRLLNQLEEGTDEVKARAMAKVPEVIHSIHFLLYGDTVTDPKPKQIEKLTPKLLDSETDLFSRMARNLNLFDFEARKQAASIMKFVIRRSAQNDCVDYIRGNPDMITDLVSKYREQELAQNVGSILQEMAKRPELCEMLLEDVRVMGTIFELVKLPNFDIASDSFKTLQTLLTRDSNRSNVARYLERNFEEFFGQINALVISENYVTQRQFLKLLGEILMERANRRVMMQYINEKENLRILMTLLKNASKAIAYESFHIFKIFVANPKKSRPIQIVLFKNKAKLLDFIENFQSERDEDEQFVEDKRLVIEKLQILEPPPDMDLTGQPTNDDGKQEQGDENKEGDGEREADADQDGHAPVEVVDPPNAEDAPPPEPDAGQVDEQPQNDQDTSNSVEQTGNTDDQQGDS